MSKTLKIKADCIRMSLIAAIGLGDPKEIVIKMKGDCDHLSFNYRTQDGADEECRKAQDTWNAYLDSKPSLL